MLCTCSGDELIVTVRGARPDTSSMSRSGLPELAELVLACNQAVQYSTVSQAMFLGVLPLKNPCFDDVMIKATVSEAGSIGRTFVGKQLNKRILVQKSSQKSRNTVLPR